jgi:putative transposase
MPRAKRLNVKDGWYHVFNRGISRKTICFTDYHFELFKSLIGDLYTEYQIETHAYCMMKNHYHLLLRTKEANLSRAMWHFGRVFSTLVNKDINGDGPLFRSRFKSLLIKDDRYMLQVHRYIHLNPVEAHICEFPWDYDWSSCNQFCEGKIKSPTGLVLKEIHDYFRGPDEYVDFLNLGNSKKVRNFYNRKNIPSQIDHLSM